MCVSLVSHLPRRTIRSVSCGDGEWSDVRAAALAKAGHNLGCTCVQYILYPAAIARVPLVLKGTPLRRRSHDDSPPR